MKRALRHTNCNWPAEHRLKHSSKSRYFMSDLRNELESVFQNVFGDDEIALKDEMTAADIDGWDSLAHINLIIAVEKRFGIRFAAAEISTLKGEGQNIGTFMKLIQAKRNAGK